MRDLIIFIIILVAIFFGVGEWRGWYLGSPPQTPMFLYKKDYVHDQSWDFTSLDNFPFEYSGKVRRGSVKVQVFYERPRSLQDNSRVPIPERQIFEQDFQTRQSINLNEVFNEGTGRYRVMITFSDASGTFNMEIPSANRRIGGGS